MTSSDQSAASLNGYRRWRRIFGGIFIVSSIVLVFLAVAALGRGPGGTVAPPTGIPAATFTSLPGIVTTTASPLTTPTATPPPAPAGGGGLGSYAGAIAIGTSCLTAASSLAGFAVTTVLGIRKERREDKAADLSRQIQQLEIEKQRLELERQRREAAEEKPAKKE